MNFKFHMENFESTLVLNQNMHEFLTFWILTIFVGGKIKELEIEIFNYLYIICSITEIDLNAIALVCY